MKEKLKKYLKLTEKYTKTDMTYVAEGGFWIGMQKAGLVLASFITMVAFGNLLPAETYGIYQYIISAGIIAGIFSLLGTPTAIIKSISRGLEGTFWAAAKERFRWSLIGSTGLLIGSGWYFFQGNLVLAGGFLIVAFLMPGEKIFEMFSDFWNGRKDFKKRTQYTLSAVFLSLLVLVPVIYLTDNVLLILLAYFGSHVLFEGFFFFKTAQQAKSNEVSKTALSFSKSLSVISGVSALASHIDKIIVWQFLGPVQVAIYSFAVLPINKVKGFIPVADLALPKLGESKIEGERKQGVMKKFLKLFLFFIPAAIILALIAPFVYEVFFPQYMESVKYFQALTALIAVGGPFALLNSALVSEIKIRSLYIINTLSPVIKIVLFFTLIPFYGIWGMVWAILASEVVRGITLIFFFRRI